MSESAGGACDTSSVGNCGSYGAIHGPITTRNSEMATITTPTTRSGSRSKTRATRTARPAIVEGNACVPVSACSATSGVSAGTLTWFSTSNLSSPRDPRVDERMNHVDRQQDQERPGRRHQNNALDGGKVE